MEGFLFVSKLFMLITLAVNKEGDETCKSADYSCQTLDIFPFVNQKKSTYDHSHCNYESIVQTPFLAFAVCFSNG